MFKAADFEPPTRRPTVHVTSGEFVASLGYDPKTGVTYEVFFAKRGSRAGESQLSDHLYELGIEISKKMQKLLGTTGILKND
jgi:hypothetical protein